MEASACADIQTHTHTPTAAADVSSRFTNWCKYLCPYGGMGKTKNEVKQRACKRYTVGN